MPIQFVQMAMRRLVFATIVLAFAFPLIYATATSTLFLQFGVERSTWVLNNLPGLGRVFECAAGRGDSSFAQNYFSGFIQVSLALSTLAGLAALVLNSIAVSVSPPKSAGIVEFCGAVAFFLTLGGLAIVDIQHGAMASVLVCGHDRFMWRMYPVLPALSVAYISISAILFASIGTIVTKVLFATMELVRGR